MARVISDILDTNRLDFKNTLDIWEKRSGQHSHDLRLYSDMRSRAIDAVKKLGLDPTDTISGELYFALQERARQDNAWLENYLKTTKDETSRKHIEKIVSWVIKNSHNKEVWVCKSAKHKQLLKKLPPKNLMKVLGLRSVDSMLKRVSTLEILTLALELEPEDWKQKYRQNYRKLKVSDYDSIKVEVKIVDDTKTEKLLKNGFDKSKIVIPNNEAGGIVVVIPQARFPLDTIAIVSSLAEALADLRKHSAYFRTVSVYKDFGQKISDVANHGIIGASSIHTEIGWNSIHRHLVGNEDFFNKVEQPYISYDEFLAQSAVDLLSKHDPRFEFWNNLEYVFFTDKHKNNVSMNLIDVVTNGVNKHTYKKSTKTYGKSKLWEELWARYLVHDNVANDIVTKFLDN